MKAGQPKQNIEARLPQLIAAARAGDQQAFTELYETASQEVYRSARAILRSEELALDVQQEVFVAAFTQLDRLDDPKKFHSWLRAIAVNMARSALRKQTPILFTELETGEGSGLPEQADLSPEASPELSMERKETARLVNEILEELSDGQRAVVSMYYYEQMPVGEIAESLGISAGTVKAQLARGRKKIETAVRGLEQRGVKLYGLSPLPFLLALMKQLRPAKKAGKTVLTESLKKAGLAAGTKAAVFSASGAAAPAVSAVGLHVGRSFFETAVGRLILALIVAGVIGGGAAGYRWFRNRLNREPDPTLPTDSERLQEIPTAPELPTDPKPLITEPSLLPAESLPTEPSTTAPTDPSAPEPSEPKPSEPKPTEPKPTEPKPTESQPTEPSESTEPPESTEPSESTEPPESTEPSEGEEHLLSGTCGKNLTWTLNTDTGLLTIAGSGEMDDKHSWGTMRDSITAVVISDGVTSIGFSAFGSCGSLSSVTLPASVKTIGNSAFRYCTGLQDVSLPEGLESIGASAFEKCDALGSVTIPASVTSLAEGAFAKCASLTEINVAAGNPRYSSPDGILIDNASSSLLSYPAGKTAAIFTVPAGLQVIDQQAFDGCVSLERVVLPEGVTRIYFAAFEGCTGLTSVELPSSLEFVGDYAFYACHSLASVEIPATVSSIGAGAFGCVGGGYVEDFTIYGAEGSAAQRYAEQYGFRFVAR